MEEKNTLLKSMFWSFAQTYASKIIGIVVSTILARLILPKEYGVIAAAQVFVSLAATFVAGGFSNSLIQKKDADEKDFSTMFFFNVAFSLAVYLLIFFLAPVLVLFFDESYERPLLIKIIRILGVGIFLSSFNAFFHAILEKRLQFKILFKISFFASVPSAIIGIFMAWRGYGVWALVAQNLVSNFASCILLLVTTKWKPLWYFSLARFKPLFSYGYKMMLSGLTITLYADLTGLVIGNRYSAETLAFYNKGTVYPKLIALNGTTAMCTALFPIMSRMQDTDEVKEVVRRINRLSAFIVTPIMFGLAMVGPAFIEILLGRNWSAATVFLQISCINYAIQPIALSSLQYLKASGKAGEYLFLDIIRKGVGLIMLFLAIFLDKGVELVAIAELVSNIIAIMINFYPGRKHINYRIREQIWDVLPKFVCSAIMCVAVYLFSLIPLPLGIGFLLQVAVGIVSYTLLAAIFRMKELREVISIVKSFYKKRQKQKNKN